MTRPATCRRRGTGAPTPAARDERAAAAVGGTRGLLEAVLRELDDGPHSHRGRAMPIARTASKRQQV
ncbi:hypothetical protein OG302_39555 [Streptomyces sp. NBC_01283]|uniref:hypothetical protein n=1 Tax=Streptomyces sp. NBC_01283 TaxID=2903812 RepID=UPI00352FC882|nr:hypothetical protein OG302_39555 [Streptomyces sp. NBC_01283]